MGSTGALQADRPARVVMVLNHLRVFESGGLLVQLTGWFVVRA